MNFGGLRLWDWRAMVIVLLTFIALVNSYIIIPPSGYRPYLPSLSHRGNTDLNILMKLKRYQHRKPETYNDCPEDTPFPCKTKGACISLKHVCDGNNDCSDGWDEDVGVCIAYQRVPAEDLLQFVRQQAYWLVPSFFSKIVTSPESLDKIASALSTSASIDVFGSKLKLDRPDIKKFQSALHAVRGNDMRALESLGMNPDSWTEVKVVFKNLIDSGLL